MKKKIIIIEDQLILNEMLKKAVSNNFEVVAVSNSAKDIPFLCDKYMPDIVLTDILTEEFENGITYGQKIKEKYLDKIKVVAITGLLDITFFEKAKKANLDGFIYKNILPEELISILENIVNGSKIYLNNNCSDSNDIKNILTKKELSILTLLCQGMDREDIADTLNVTMGTLKNHISSILNKLEFDNVSKLLIYIISNGYITTLK